MSAFAPHDKNERTFTKHDAKGRATSSKKTGEGVTRAEHDILPVVRARLRLPVMSRVM